MSNRLCVLIALPRPIVTLMASKDGEIVPAPRWEKAHGAMAVPPLRETPKLDAVYGALRGRPSWARWPAATRPARPTARGWPSCAPALAAAKVKRGCPACSAKTMPLHDRWSPI